MEGGAVPLKLLFVSSRYLDRPLRYERSKFYEHGVQHGCKDYDGLATY